MKKILTVLLSIMLLAFAFGCDKVEKLQEYTQGDFTIMLPAGVEVSEEDGFEAFFAAEDYAVTVVKDEFDIFEQLDIDPTTYSEEDYGKLILELYDVDGAFTFDKNNHLYYSYENSVDGETYFYYVTVRKGTDAFWLITFLTEADKQKTLVKSFEIWNNTISVK